MALATRSDLLTQFLVWLGRPADPIFTSTILDDILTLAEGRIFYGADPPLASPPLRIRAMEGYAQFPLVANQTGAETAGSANAQTSVLSGFTLAYGSTATVPSGLTNTGSMTLNIGSSGARTVTKGQARSNLAAGDWRDDISYQVWYDGTNYVLVPAPGAVPLPTDYLEPRRVWLHGEAPLQYRPQPVFFANHIGGTAGQPTEYATDGDCILFGPVPDAAYQAHLLYWKRFAALTAGTDTNWLLTNYPSVYLYAMLLESAPFLGHDERMTTWHSLYASAVAGITRSAGVARDADTDQPAAADEISDDARK